MKNKSLAFLFIAVPFMGRIMETFTGFSQNTISTIACVLTGNRKVVCEDTNNGMGKSSFVDEASFVKEN